MASNTGLSALLLCASALSASTVAGTARAVDLGSLSITDLLDAQSGNQLSCVDIAKASLRRIAQLDGSLKVFISVNPHLLSDAAALDAQRAGKALLPMHCVPVAVKDNIDVAGLPTTGGSVLLRGNQPARDATAVRRLRAAGALIVGKTNLDEFAVAGSTISSILGQTLNPYDTTRFAAGSSGGSSVAVSTGMAVCALGTETVNSLRNAAGSAGVVAVRPTHGVVSRAGVIPQSSTMDIVGPICKTVADAASVLSVIAGRDYLDPETTAYEGLSTPVSREKLQPASLAGKTFGVMRNLFGKGVEHEPVNTVIAAAMRTLRQSGAEIVEIDDTEFDSDLSSQKLNVSNYEFRPLFEAWLANLPAAPGVVTVHDYYEMGRFPRSTMEKFLKNAVAWKDPLNMPAYRMALQYRYRMHEKVLTMMKDLRLDALVYPSQQRPPLTLDDKPRPERNGIFASALGFPAIDIPAGFTPATADAPLGLPVGIDMMGRPGEDMQLLSLSWAVERKLKARREPDLAAASDR
jgi:Asp-tRNA(Asn)/Glu-tRNA(Gln) amidotransferase A subunit family amidase